DLALQYPSNTLPMLTAPIRISAKAESPMRMAAPTPKTALRAKRTVIGLDRKPGTTRALCLPRLRIGSAHGRCAIQFRFEPPLPGSPDEGLFILMLVSDDSAPPSSSQPSVYFPFEPQWNH